jgi:hypothetical protein
MRGCRDPREQMISPASSDAAVTPLRDALCAWEQPLRQRRSSGRPPGAGDGGQVRPSPSAVPAGSHLRPPAWPFPARRSGAFGVRLQPLVDALKAQVLGCAVVHADEIPVAMLAPGTGKTHRSYLQAYASGAFETLRAVVYDFTDSRAGEHARAFLGDWRGSLVCDDFSGYKAGFALGVTEMGCMAHARRKFVELHVASESTIAATASSPAATPGRRELACGQHVSGEPDRPIAVGSGNWLFASPPDAYCRSARGDQPHRIGTVHRDTSRIQAAHPGPPRHLED